MKLRHISHGYHSPASELPGLLEWYRILRAHHHWTIFSAIRFALSLWR